jgi:UDP-hydrolysing UDP-N-acetyl-D-glucosamine 2-epimerase
MNIPLAHTMGGEVSGTIDESIRHAVTKFAHIHFPASKDAQERIVKLGEPAETVHLVGCPRIDLVSEILKEKADKYFEGVLKEGVGASVDFDRPFLLISQHPVTTEYGEGEKQIWATLEAARRTEIPTVVLWPNADAGSEDISRGIRKWRERKLDANMHFFKNLPTATYIHLMKKAACLVGNSSSGIREGAFIGTPVVNIGTRQFMRERGKNVIEVPHELEAIHAAIMKQVKHGPYPMEPIYGDGSAGERIADILAKMGPVNVQKRINY